MKKSKADIANPFRERLIPKLKSLVEIAQAAEIESWVTSGWPTDDARPNFDDGENGDAFVVMRDDLRDLHQIPYVRARCTTIDFDPVRVALQMLDFAHPEREAINPSNARYYKKHLEQIDRARYVLIVLTHEVELPTTEGAASYVGGHVKGAALLYEIDTATLRGGFEYYAENRWQVQGSDRTIAGKLQRDLESRFSAAIIDGIKRRFPEGDAPSTVGYL